MIESKLISKKRELETALRLGIRDPARKDYVLKRLIQIDREIAALGFSKEEIKTNALNYGPSDKTVESKQFFVPTTSMWMTSANEEPLDKA